MKRLSNVLAENGSDARWVAQHGRTLYIMCPGCKSMHALEIQKPNRLGGLWAWDGSVDAPTFSPSLLVRWDRSKGGEHVCHSYIRSGSIQFLPDSTHALAGQTVPLLPIAPE
jgi:hypothetical protein